jgi:hypothetical protein
MLIQLNKMLLLYVTFISFFLSTAVFSNYDQDGIYFTSFLGSSISLPSNLKIKLDDQADYNHRAKWQGRSFEDSPYYSLRFDKINNHRGWGIEWMHHKIYLANPKHPVNSFSISDGFNILYLNRVLSNKRLTFRPGFGLVFSHMDVRIKDRERFYLKGGNGGAYLSGVSVQGAIEKWIYETERHFINLETKLTVSYVKPPVSSNPDEYAEITNIAIHFVFGFGSKPIRNDNATAMNRLYYWGLPTAHHLLLGQDKLGFFN